MNLKTTKRRDVKITLRKTESGRAYARSISLREDQIKRLQDAGVKNISELFQKLVDDWLLLRDSEEAEKLRERAALLTYKYRILTGEDAKNTKPGEAWAIMEEAHKLTSKAEEIERNIEAD